ncbi:hypothetical protein [uncultured Cardiobacterium sp.]|uniref:hypothetical protein n=1 Tax=uncultured Cardiobacterium sp. TaxID=417619 RepID=UPI002601C5A7|nr:hypothetical protein [uncultured Cardiobacterium sp.]
MKNVPLTARVYADFDNERPARHIVGLSQTGSVRHFDGTTRIVTNGDYLHLYMDCGDGEYCVSAGIVIASPFPARPYKWVLCAG